MLSVLLNAISKNISNAIQSSAHASVTTLDKCNNLITNRYNCRYFRILHPNNAIVAIFPHNIDTSDDIFYITYALTIWILGWIKFMNSCHSSWNQLSKIIFCMCLMWNAFVAFVSPTLSENWIPRILLSFIKLEIQYITNTLHQQRDP